MPRDLGFCMKEIFIEAFFTGYLYKCCVRSYNDHLLNNYRIYYVHAHDIDVAIMTSYATYRLGVGSIATCTAMDIQLYNYIASCVLTTIA